MQKGEVFISKEFFHSGLMRKGTDSKEGCQDLNHLYSGKESHHTST